MFGKLRKVSSAGLAKERLQSILAADRLHCSNEEIKQVETEMYHSIRKFFHVKPSQIRTRIVQKNGEGKENKEFLFIFEAIIQE